MAHPLHDRGSPRVLAASRQSFDFKKKLSDFRRLVEIVEADLTTVSPSERPSNWARAPVQGELAFGFADAGEDLPLVRGYATTELTLVCQRCLEPLTLPVRATLEHVLIEAADTESADFRSGGQPQAYEVWELESDQLVPQELVEEAIIMCIPMTAMHESIESCGPLAHRVDGAAEEERDTSVRPFADLKALMDKTD